MKAFVLLSLMTLLSLGFASLGATQDVDQQSCQQTLQNNCARCHGLKKICNKLDMANANWQMIVTDMGLKGKLSQDVQDSVVTCLTKSSGPKRLVCDSIVR